MKRLQILTPIALVECFAALYPAKTGPGGSALSFEPLLNPEVPGASGAGRPWDLALTNPPYLDALRDDAHKVNGCVSQVWLNAETDSQGDGAGDPVIHFQGDSDAMIVRGLIAVLIALFSGLSAAEIAKVDPKAELERLSLTDHLSSQRSNGLSAMVARIRETAAARV